MALFRAGQFIVYGNLGVCSVESVGLLQFCGASPKEYYTLRPFFAKNNDRIYIPTSSDVFMRPILKPEEADSFLRALKNTDVAVFCSRNQATLMMHYQTMLQTNSPLEQLKLFKEICQKEQMQKRQGKKLNHTDQHFYKLTEQLLSEEFAVSLHETPAAMRTRLHQAALC